MGNWLGIFLLATGALMLIFGAFGKSEHLMMIGVTVILAGALMLNDK